MPPCGHLDGMAVLVAARLAEDEEIAFNAGPHTALSRRAYRDFARLVQPKVITMASPEGMTTARPPAQTARAHDGGGERIAVGVGAGGHRVGCW
jgi:hypothetical protein